MKARTELNKTRQQLEGSYTVSCSVIVVSCSVIVNTAWFRRCFEMIRSGSRRCRMTEYSPALKLRLGVHGQSRGGEGH